MQKCKYFVDIKIQLREKLNRIKPSQCLQIETSSRSRRVQGHWVIQNGDFKAREFLVAMTSSSPIYKKPKMLILYMFIEKC